MSQKQGMRLQRKSQAAWARNFCCKKNQAAWTRNPCYEKNQVTWRCAAKGWRGRPQSPLLASAEATPLLSEKSRYGRQDQQFDRAHLARHSTGGEKAAWGRSCGSAKLLAGTLRCLRLGWRLPLERSSAKELGRCPKPHKGCRPLTLQGADEKGRSPPLTLFWRPGLSAFPLQVLQVRFNRFVLAVAIEVFRKMLSRNRFLHKILI